MIPHRRRAATAFHEAAHAVVGRALGLNVHEVTVVPDELFRGSTVLAPCVVNPAFAAYAIAALAGECAHRRVDPATASDASARDRAAALQDVRWIATAPSTEAALAAYCLAEAEALVDREWSLIALVADELLRRGTLSGAEVDALLHPIEAAVEAAVSIARKRVGAGMF